MQIKTFWKIESVNKAFFVLILTTAWNFFFRNKTFLFFKIESWNFQVQFEIEFRETLQNFNSIRQLIKKDENNNCLNKLNEWKFCEVSQILISNWTWKFLLSILKNKKVLFLKKYSFGHRQYQNKKALFTDSIFREDFATTELY